MSARPATPASRPIHRHQAWVRSLRAGPPDRDVSTPIAVLAKPSETVLSPSRQISQAIMAEHAASADTRAMSNHRRVCPFASRNAVRTAPTLRAVEGRAHLGSVETRESYRPPWSRKWIARPMPTATMPALQNQPMMMATIKTTLSMSASLLMRPVP